MADLEDEVESLRSLIMRIARALADHPDSIAVQRTHGDFLTSSIYTASTRRLVS